MLRLGGHLGPNWNPTLIRPPGALPEKEFLLRCIKCGQCMRICPTNVIHPAGLQGGIESLWTPVLNFRLGTSGCQANCIACGNLCPTAAIRPLNLEERLGKPPFAEKGPLKIGTAFVDRGRCLPWAMNIPCIVCQENCPVSPKAIFTREVFSTIRHPADLIVQAADMDIVEIKNARLTPERFSSGDYYIQVASEAGYVRRLILSNTTTHLTLAAGDRWPLPPSSGSTVKIQVRLQRPFVDPQQCIGCGVCEHECPIQGKRAIRITAENESRAQEHRLVL
jgi:ferredoxin